MCNEITLVPIPDFIWAANGIFDFNPDHPEYGLDSEGRKCLAIDSCIVPAVQALWAAGIVTLSCCCGHGDPWGVLTVQTQAGVGQRGAMTLRVDRYEELLAAEAALKASSRQEPEFTPAERCPKCSAETSVIRAGCWCEREDCPVIAAYRQERGAQEPTP